MTLINLRRRLLDNKANLTGTILTLAFVIVNTLWLHTGVPISSAQMLIMSALAGATGVAYFCNMGRLHQIGRPYGLYQFLTLVWLGIAMAMLLAVAFHKMATPI